jgi:polar amino acid transport system substrate-binding protein
MQFAELLTALETSKIDLILSGMTITSERNMKVAFVGPYFISGKAILTKHETLASARGAQELNDPATTLAALKGSTSQAFVQKLAPKARLIATKDYDEAVNLVRQGKADAMVADYPICLISVLRYPDDELLTVVTPFTYEPIGIALPPNEPLFTNWLENFLGTLDGGGFLQELTDRWFENDWWLDQLP